MFVAVVCAVLVTASHWARVEIQKGSRGRLTDCRGFYVDLEIGDTEKKSQFREFDPPASAVLFENAPTNQTTIQPGANYLYSKQPTTDHLQLLRVSLAPQLPSLLFALCSIST